MLERYLSLKESLKKVEDDAVEDLLPNKQENKKIDELSSLFSNLNSISKMVQSDSALLCTVRALFDGVIKKFRSTKSRSVVNAEIVKDPDFESGVSIIQGKRLSELTNQEKKATSTVQLCIPASEEKEGNNLLFAHKILQEEESLSSIAYMDLRFLMPILNICERLFQGRICSK